LYQGTASAVPLSPFIFVIPTEPAAAGERRDLLFLSIAKPFFSSLFSVPQLGPQRTWALERA